MKWQGAIDFQKPIKINGKPHGVEHETTLPTWDSGYIGRVVHTEDTDKLWFGGTSDWAELTPGGVGAHDHDTIYYTETEIDNFFEGEDSGKKQVDFSRVINKPSLYSPTIHSNSSHSETYITSTEVTFETLQTNGDVGNGSDQLAIGSHNHDTTYALISHNHDTVYAPISHDHDDLYYTETELQTSGSSNVHWNNLTNVPTEFTPTSHTHDDRYYTETNMQTSGQAILHWDNLSNVPTEFAPSAHTHDDLYFTESEISSTTGGSSGADLVGATPVGAGTSSSVQGILEELDSNIQAINAEAATYEALDAVGDIGTGSDQVAQGDHNHDSTYSAIGHNHDGTYEPVFSKNTGFNLNLGTTAGTVSEGNHTHTESDITDLDKYTTTEVDTMFNEILIPSTSGAPTDAPTTNTVRFDASTNTLYIYNGTSWVSTVLS